MVSYSSECHKIIEESEVMKAYGKYDPVGSWRCAEREERVRGEADVSFHREKEGIYRH